MYFLHDELLLCGPDLEADRVERIVREGAAEAARLLFGRVPVDFPVDRVERIVREGAAEAARLLFGRVPVDFPVSVARVRNYADGK